MPSLRFVMHPRRLLALPMAVALVTAVGDASGAPAPALVPSTTSAASVHAASATPTSAVQRVPTTVGTSPHLSTSTTVRPARSGRTPSLATATTRSPRGRLIFEDHFGSDRLSGRWSLCYPWGTPTGCTNHGNDEDQWYVPQQVTVSDGAVRLTAVRRPALGVDRDGRPQTFPFTSGMITSYPAFTFRYGYVEFRADLPTGQAMWPALWTLPVDLSWPPEIDIMEAVGQHPDHLSTTYHGRHRRYMKSMSLPGLSSGWHTFGVDWRPRSITWFVDGQEVYRVATAPSRPMYLLANLAVGGTGGGPVTGQTPDRATFKIDYVKVWAPPR